ncbi:MAG: molecular chaperone DnaJ, partial [Candidatus Falkowbacteria bacterium]|nr:molecular chaperone DnaJ [Candidatus Falkowbacteria bacterium]
MSKDYYNILGVNKNASPDEIKTAFRKKAHEHHPDKGGNAEKFKEFNEAYQVLGNPEKRKQYDQFGSAFQNGQAGGAGGFGGFSGFEGFSQGGMNFDMEDLGDMFGGFGDIFGFGSGRRSSREQARGRDLEMALSLDFMEAAFGTEKEVNFPKIVTCNKCRGNGAEPGAKVETCPVCHGSGRVNKIQRTILGNIQTQTVCAQCEGEGKIPSQKCSKCKGSGQVKDDFKIKVKIPAGINSGESIRLSGQGEAGAKGAPAGDLYLRIKVSPHKKFNRDGYDINTEEIINFVQASLGDKITIQTIDGLLTLKIPEGTQSGTVFKLKEKGITKLHGRGQGDQYVKIIVKTPGNL